LKSPVATTDRTKPEPEEMAPEDEMEDHQEAMEEVAQGEIAADDEETTSSDPVAPRKEKRKSAGKRSAKTQASAPQSASDIGASDIGASEVGAGSTSAGAPLALGAKSLESDTAAFLLLLRQGLINNGREMVAYRGPFQCGIADCGAVILNNKLVVRHWNIVHR